MKRTFLAKRNALLSSRSISWGICALLLVSFLLLIRLLAPNVFLQMVTPFLKASDAFTEKSKTFFTSFGDTARLAAANERLVTENTALGIENQALVQKVTNLGALLGTPTMQKEIPGILIGVVARPPVSPYDSLVLGEGSKSGVMVGMEAFGEGNVPIGIVSSVLADFSHVTLFSSPGVTTSGWVGQKSIPLSLMGTGGGTFEASVARAAGVEVGDVVSVPGPGERPLGKVIRIDSDPLSPGVILRIQPATNLFGISWVVVRATGVVPITFATSTAP